MALIGVHGLQSDAAAVLDHLARHLVGQTLQALFPLGPVILGVQLDTDPAAGAVDGVAGELLDGVQSLAPAADDGAKALTFQEHLVASLFREIHLDLCLNLHLLKEAGKELADLLSPLVIHFLAQILRGLDGLCFLGLGSKLLLDRLFPALRLFGGLLFCPGLLGLGLVLPDLFHLGLGGGGRLLVLTVADPDLGRAAAKT